MTLLELMVVLAILGIAAGVVGLAAWRTPRSATVDTRLARVEAARDAALRTGRTVTIEIEADGRRVAATALPDGRVIADSALDIDALDGRANTNRGRHATQ